VIKPKVTSNKSMINMTPGSLKTRSFKVNLLQSQPHLKTKKKEGSPIVSKFESKSKPLVEFGKEDVKPCPESVSLKELD
jgi:hypothetical protein